MLEWKNSEIGILRTANKSDDAVWVLLLQELRRLCRRFIGLTPSQIAEAIRDAHRKQLHQEFPKVTILEIENELHLAMKKAESPMALPVHSNWSGNPVECLDRNWPEIWAKSVEKSKEKGEKVRSFMWEYLDECSTVDRESIRIRELAHGEMIRRVFAHPRFSHERAAKLIREEMRNHLVAAFPKYVGDIERQVWTIDIGQLNELSAEICGKDQTRGAMKFIQRPNLGNCQRLVAFDLYAEIMGCVWPTFEGRKAPREDLPKMPPKMDIPTSLDEI